MRAPSACALSLIQKVKRVVGIELCQEAVEDARVNAHNNGESRGPTQQAVTPAVHLSIAPGTHYMLLGQEGGWGPCRRHNTSPNVHPVCLGEGKHAAWPVFSQGTSGRGLQDSRHRARSQQGCCATCRVEQRRVPLREGRGSGACPGEQTGLPAAHCHPGPTPCWPA